ncbi:MAG: TIGR04283 family arsenosugar biosynthesis glycosyltransferase [Gammaproteobacteria bacterium]|nr:TIGR04283 family arsenosugar biosynthesis glycosyltransferase [Gammaproteobacteria bacterium]
MAAAGDTGPISIIIPALNEAGTLQATLKALQTLRHHGHELIVVDGGSRDSTVGESRPYADQVLQSPAGRALQMQAGAGIASGRVLWFLHADTLVPENAAAAISDALRDNRYQWGRFDIRFADTTLLLRLVAALANLRSRLSGIATGDQGIFVTRELFDRVHGFPPIALMEDIALSRSLKACSRPACLRQQLTTSARRWHSHGVIRTIVLMWSLRFGYFLGIAPDTLARYYQTHRA